MRSRSESSPPEFASTEAPSAFGLALVQAAGGDPHLLQALKALAWEAYLEVGAPLGRDEAGLRRWWSDRLEARWN
jgi:hypothetical protein